MVIFITLMSLTTAKPFNICWRPDSEEANKTKSFAKKETNNFAFSNCDTLIGLAQPIHPGNVNYYEYER